MKAVRPFLYVAATLLVGLAISRISPTLYESRFVLPSEEATGYGLPPQRTTLLLRQSIRLPEEWAKFQSCAEVEGIPREAEWLADLETFGLTVGDQGIFDIRELALAIQFVEGVGYGVRVLHRDEGITEAQSVQIAAVLRCWTREFAERESHRQDQRFETDLEKIRELLSKSTRTVDSDTDEYSQGLSEELSRFERRAGWAPDGKRPTEISDAIAYFEALVSRPWSQEDREKLESLRSEWLSHLEGTRQRARFDDIEKGAAQSLLLAAYRRTFQNPVSLPIPTGEVEGLSKATPRRLIPAWNAIVVSLLALAILASLARRIDRNSTQSLETTPPSSD